MAIRDPYDRLGLRVPPLDIVQGRRSIAGQRTAAVPVADAGAPSAAPGMPTGRAYPPWDRPTPGSVEFTIPALAPGQSPTGVLPAGQGLQLSLPVWQYQLQAHYKGVVRIFTYFASQPDPTFNVTYSLRFNSAIVPGWSFSPFGRSATSMQFDESGWLRVPVGTLIDVVVTNNAASGPWTVGCKFAGWAWTEQEERRLFGDFSY